MLDIVKWFFSEAVKVWKWKYAFWWICVLIYTAFYTYVEVCLCVTAVPMLTPEYWEVCTPCYMALPIGIIGMYQLYGAWKEER